MPEPERVQGLQAHMQALEAVTKELVETAACFAVLLEQAPTTQLQDPLVKEQLNALALEVAFLTATVYGEPE